MNKAIRRSLHLLIISAITAIFGVLTVFGVSAEVGDTFTVNTAEGAPITYKITSEGAFPEVEVADCLKDYKGAVTLSDYVENPNNSLEYSVTSIGKQAFEDCKLTSLVIPYNITNIGNFAFERCRKLKTIKIYNNTPPQLYKTVFYYCVDLENIYIPIGTKDAYINADWPEENLTEENFNNIYGTVKNASGEIVQGAEVCLYNSNGTKIESTNTNSNGEYALHTQLIDGVDYTITIKKDDYIETSKIVGSGFVETVLINPFSFEISGGVDISYQVKSQNISDNTGTVKILSASEANYNGQLSIPSTVEYDGYTYTVTEIGEKAFSNCEKLTSVTIPDSIITIGDYAFSYCPNLTEIISYSRSPAVLGKEVLGYHSYDNVKVYIPAITKSDYIKANWPEENLYELAFIANTIEGAPIKYGLLTLDKNSKTGTVEVSKFCDTSYRGKVAIPETVKYNGFNFTVTSIGDFAFSYYGRITGVTIPDSVELIEEEAFSGCQGLIEVNFGSNSKLEEIGKNAFSGCKKLNSFTIPSNVKNIGDRAFGYCYGLTESVTESKMPATIGVDVFAECSANFKINIVAGMKEDYISKGWPKDKLEESIYFNITQNTVEGAAIIYQVTYLDSATETGTVKVAYGNDRNYSPSITIPETIEYQGITYTVTEIGEKAFEWYEFLEGITLPSTVTTIGDHAFEKCSRLKSVDMPGVENIGYASFSQCKSLNNITLSACVKNIDDFAFYKCSSLDTVKIESETPPTFGFNVFGGCSPNLEIKIPEVAVNVYKSSESWSEYEIVQNNV